ncbi:MAG: ATP-binding domain-containing protein, partial [Clostridia bacterium]|nr:ATP-binding domain-containing protein [Clostridia bacterium]
KAKLENFLSQVKEWIGDSLDMPVNELVKKIVADTKIKESYEGDSDESVNKRANIDEFVSSVEDYCRLNPTATLSDYLNQVTLSSDTDDMDDGNYVTLATIHSVKGLEFRGVFVAGLEDNIIPTTRAHENDNDMEEERRLMYVAITRAKERLYLTRSKSRYLYGKREPTMRSRFLKELSSELPLPSERRASDFDGFYADDDPDFYGNSSYGSGRFSSRNDGNSYGNSYGNSSYGGNAWGNSAPKRSTWQGNSSYGNSSYKSPSSYGNSSYGNSSYGGQNRSQSQGGGAITYGGVGSAVNKTKQAGKDLSAFKTGVKVYHPKFENGVVVAVRGVGANTILDIAFEKYGIKQLSASLAPLTVKS